jgi:hypothetical protein
MQEKTYYYSKQKLLVRTVVAGVILLVCSSLVFGALSTGQTRRIGLLILVGIVGLGAALFILLSIPILFSKAKKEIELNDKGIYSSGNDGSRIGLIPWGNVSQITRNKIKDKDYICVHVRDISGFAGKANGKERRAILASNHIALLIDNRNVNDDLSGILSEVQRFFNKYGTTTTAPQGNNDLGTKATGTAFDDLRVKMLDAQVFLHYDSGLKRAENFEDPTWLHENVFFWSFDEKFANNSAPPEVKNYGVRFFVFAKPFPSLLKFSKLTPASGDEEKYCFNANNKLFPFERLFKTGSLKYIKRINKQQHIFYDLTKIYAMRLVNDGSSPKKEIILGQAISDNTVHLFQIDK